MAKEIRILDEDLNYIITDSDCSVNNGKIELTLSGNYTINADSVANIMSASSKGRTIQTKKVYRIADNGFGFKSAIYVDTDSDNIVEKLVENINLKEDIIKDLTAKIKELESSNEELINKNTKLEEEISLHNKSILRRLLAIKI